MEPKLIVHGGAGRSIANPERIKQVKTALHSIVEQVYQRLQAGIDASDAVVLGCQLLENESQFNAGTGSVLQSDGQIRMSAGFMNGPQQRFSGVINISRVQNPIQLAQQLQSQRDRVVSESGGIELTRELQVPIYDPLTEYRISEWLQQRKQNFASSMAEVVSEATTSSGEGTIGVVALDQHQQLAVGTSTGGKGLERIGRVSDSAMPAGNYANDQAAVSCTGIGEDIIDECLAAKVVTRVSDGFGLSQAMERSMAEADNKQRKLGAIALDASGEISWGKTSKVLLAAYHDGNQIQDTLQES